MQKPQLAKIESSRNKYFWMRLDYSALSFFLFNLLKIVRWVDQSDK